MASAFGEKLQVAVITATLVSAAWIVAGAFFLDREESRQLQELAQPVAADPMAPDPDAQPAMDVADEAVSSPPEADTATLMIPVMGIAFADLDDTFADGRDGSTRLHQALDIAAEAGTSVVAAAPGTVERMFASDVGGNTIYVRSADRETIYYYAHLAEYASGLSEGQQIRRGQRLGTVGSTGAAEPDSPHLHFEVMRTTPEAEWWEPAISVNPYELLANTRQ